MDISKKTFIFFCIIQIILISYQATAHQVLPINQPEPITTVDDFYQCINNTAKNGSKAVLFLQMNNCPHCKALMQAYQKNMLNSKYQSLDFRTANGPMLQAHELVKNISANKINIPGYPVILYVKNGKILDHQIGGDAKTLTAKLNNLLTSN